jgi:CRP/FNR family cyclic AMP-dependent transcriptional regulator
MLNFAAQLHAALGWAAAGLTLLAFSCTGVLRLRIVALAANAAFIAYGVSSQLWPVVALHLVLVPVNLWHLRQARRSATAGQAAADRASRLTSSS